MHIFEPSVLPARARYQLLTSLVVPRPIAWVSSRSAAGQPNLAPFSYFAALSATPFLVGVSIGHRRGAPKDTLRNVRETGAFCVNLAAEARLSALNETSGEFPPEVDEFAPFRETRFSRLQKERPVPPKITKGDHHQHEHHPRDKRDRPRRRAEPLMRRPASHDGGCGQGQGALTGDLLHQTLPITPSTR